jgi:hypothetical protein
MANDGWERAETGTDKGGAPTYEYRRRGTYGELVIARADGSHYTLRYRVGTETTDGYMYRVKGVLQRFTTLQSAKDAAGKADACPIP